MPITISDDPIEDDTSTRYIAVFTDAPVLVNIHDLINLRTSEGTLIAVAVAQDGSSDTIGIEFDPNRGAGTWTVYPESDDERVIEEIAYDSDGGVVFHWKFISGFTNDGVPTAN